MHFINTYYGFIPVIGIFSLAILFTIIFNCLIFKTKLKIKDIALVPVLLFGSYTLIPFTFTCIGLSFKNPDALTIALKLSITPFEKNEIYYQLGKAYGTFEKKLNGNLAIKYYEKFIRGQYGKYISITDSLLELYLYKGEYDKVIEIKAKICPHDKSKPYEKMELVYMNIMQKKYNEAIKCYNNSLVLSINDDFLLVDLLKIVGEDEAALRVKKSVSERSADGWEMKPKKNIAGVRAYFNSVEDVQESIAALKKIYKF